MAFKAKKVFFRLDPAYKKCPSCGEVNALRRSRTKNAFESLLKLTQIYKMYRCRKCNWRGALSTIVIISKSIRNLLVSLLLLGLLLLFIRLVLGGMYG